ncbi:MAG: HK97 family phage prohead protease [Lachnospiraceae bacterium]|nr:HK97 family phage prohead protease [Lachnospiraceae bacterium]
MRIEVRSDKVVIDGYVNAVGRDSRPMIDKGTGQRFVEQIVPGVFKRALKSNEVQLLLNHDSSRNLGSTETNLTLYEDDIGLRAHAEVTDAEVIEKARNKKLRGWSFGFHELGASEEDTANGMKRRFVEEMELVEVSIIDDRKIPCYRGTSIEARATGDEAITADVIETRATYVEDTEHKDMVDFNSYRERIRKVEVKK